MMLRDYLGRYEGDGFAARKYGVKELTTPHNKASQVRG
jgi:hypothetical protein